VALSETEKFIQEVINETLESQLLGF